MASDRRVATHKGANRQALLNAAEQLMREEGYAAVTSRRVAAKAGLKPQLVHYYFRTMDDLFVALLRRVVDDYLGQQTDIFGSGDPIRRLVELSRDEERVVLTTEFLALANHRESVRNELVRFSKIFRGTEAKIIRMKYEQHGLTGELLPDPIVLASFIEAISRIMVMEAHLGIDHGHVEAYRYIDSIVRLLDGARPDDDGVSPDAGQETGLPTEDRQAPVQQET